MVPSLRYSGFIVTPKRSSPAMVAVSGTSLNVTPAIRSQASSAPRTAFRSCGFSVMRVSKSV